MTEIEIRNKITGVVVVTTAAVCTGYYQSVGFKKTSGVKFLKLSKEMIQNYKYKQNDRTEEVATDELCSQQQTLRYDSSIPVYLF